VIEGPKACGKTETARQVAASEVRLDVEPNARQAAAVDPSLVLQGAAPRLVDEWQLAPGLWNHVRRAVDRDLRIYAQACDAEVLHYKDNTDLDVESVVEMADGRWAAFEVKLGARAVDEGADSLRRFASRVDTPKCGLPLLLGVITGTGLAYTRPDGVAVIPIGALGP
jgi:hypothetical protein